MSKRSLYELYNASFETIIADTDHLREICHTLRHHVYAIENPFEPQNEMGIESDSYDEDSIHFLLRHRASGIFVGTARIILPVTDAKALPPYRLISEEQSINLPQEIAEPALPEISRFAISKTCLRQALMETQNSSTDESLQKDLRRLLPCMALGLIAAMYQFLRLVGYEKCCATMEPSLLRLLSKLGINFIPVGEPVNHHGLRQIAYIDLDDLIEDVSVSRPDVADIIAEGSRRHRQTPVSSSMAEESAFV